jgi:hypothetical protein
MKYPINYNIEYNDDKGYRRSLRELFTMDSSKYSEKIQVLNSIEKLDEVTEDEISYDEDASSKMMNYIFDKTKKHKAFQKLYVAAALRMFSVDKSIGLAVLFSYDYLKIFHLCLVDYFNDTEKFDEENINYKNLIKIIS